MLQRFSHQALLKSTIIGCLLFSSSLIPLQSTVANPQILTTPQAKTIAQQVLQDAIAKEKLDNTAKVVQVARIGKGDTWMYNPVPYWKIAIARTVFNAAQSDLKQPIANLSITQVAPRFYCLRTPTAAPNEPCIPTQRLDGWNVTVTNFQKSLTYTVNLSGKILSKR